MTLFVAATSGFDWLTFAVAVYAALASTSAIGVTIALWRRSGPRLVATMRRDVRIATMRITLRNVGRLPIQVRWVELVGRRPNGERFARVAEETTGPNRRKPPFELAPQSTDEFLVDLRGHSDAIKWRVLVETGTGKRVWSRRSTRLRRLAFRARVWYRRRMP